MLPLPFLLHLLGVPIFNYILNSWNWIYYLKRLTPWLLILVLQSYRYVVHLADEFWVNQYEVPLNSGRLNFLILHFVIFFPGPTWGAWYFVHNIRMSNEHASTLFDLLYPNFSDISRINLSKKLNTYMGFVHLFWALDCNCDPFFGFENVKHHGWLYL